MDCREYPYAVHGQSRRSKDKDLSRVGCVEEDSISTLPRAWNDSHDPDPQITYREHAVEHIDDDDITTCSVSTVPRRHLSLPSTRAELIHHESPYGPATSVYPKALSAHARRSWQQQEALISQMTMLDISRYGGRDYDDPATPDQCHRPPRTRRYQKSHTTNQTVRSRRIHEYGDYPSSSFPGPRRSSSSYPSSNRATPPKKEGSHFHMPERDSSSVPSTHHGRYYSSYGDGKYSDSSYPVKKHPLKSTNPEKSSSSKEVWVEISPGVRMRLRGAAETRACIARDFFLPHLCFSCSLEVFCIQDASYLLCPQCRVVNPVATHDDFANDHGGLGLGFTIDELAKIQEELRSEQGRKLHGKERQAIPRQPRKKQYL